MLDERERGEESRYIRAQEERRKKEMRDKLEQILLLDDQNVQKQDLVELLSEKDKSKEIEPSIFERMGIDDWKFAVPIGGLAALSLVDMGVLILDADMALAGCFTLFCATMYQQVGGMAGQALADHRDAVSKKVGILDDAIRGQMEAAIASNELALTIEDDLKDRYELIDNLAAVQADVLNHMEEHHYREAVSKKLDSLYALEEATTIALRNRAVSAVKASVIDQFTNDRKAKDLALNQAIAVLANGAKGSMGKDVVGEAFVTAFQTYRENYKNQKGPDEILVKLDKEMAAIAEAPVVTAKGGNVYATHGF